MANDPSLSITIAADASEADAEISKVQREFDDFAKTLKKPIGELDSFIALKRKISETGDAFKLARDRVVELTAKIEESENPPKALAKELKGAEAEVKKFQGSLAYQAVELQRLGVSLQAAGVNTSRMASEKMRLKRSLDEATLAARAEISALEETRKKALEAAAAQSALDSASKALGAEFTALLRSLGKTPEYISSFSAMAARMIETGKAVEGVDRETIRLLVTYKQLTDLAKNRDILGLVPHAEIRRQVSRVEAAFNGLRISGKLTEKELAQASLATRQRVQELEDKTNGVTKALGLARGELAKLAVAGGGLGLAIKGAISFESAMADVRKVVDGTDEELAHLESTIKSMSRELPISAEGLAEIAAAGGQLGVATKDLDLFIQLAAEMSVAFNMSSDQAGQAVAKLSNIFGIAINDIRPLGDAINVLGNNTAATEAQIVDVVTRTGGMARQFGLSAEQTAALSAAMLSLGKTPEVAASGINALLGKLQTAKTQSSEFKGALNDLGLEAVDLARDISEHPQEALNRFLKSLQGLDRMKKAEVLSKLFGQEYQDDIAGLVNGLEQYDKALGLVADKTKTAGSLTREYEARAKTTANQLQLLQNSVSEAANDIGSVFLPLVNAGVGGLTGMTHAVADLAEHFPIITGIATGLGTVAVSVGALRTAWLALRVVMAGAGETAVGVLTRMTFSAKEAATAVSAIGNSFKVLGAFTAGWAVGTWLSKEFEIVRKAGVFMVEVLMKSLEELQFEWESLKAVFSDDTLDAAVERHQKRLGEMNGIFASMYKEVEDKAQGAGKKVEEATEKAAEGAKKMGEAAAAGMTVSLDVVQNRLEATIKKQEELALKSKGASDLVSKSIQVMTSPDVGFDVFSKIINDLTAMRNRSAEFKAVIDKELPEALSKLSPEGLERFRGRAEVAFSEVKDGSLDLSYALSASLDGALLKLGVDTEKFRSGMSTAGKEAVDSFTAMAERSDASATQIMAAFDATIEKLNDLKSIENVQYQIEQLVQAGIISVDQGTAALQRLKEKAGEVAESLDPIEAAFKRLGIESAKHLASMAEEAKRAFEQVRQAAMENKATTEDVARAWEAYSQKAIAAARAQSKSEGEATERALATERVYLNLGDAAEKLGEKGQTAGHKMAEGMREVKAAAEEATNSVKNTTQAVEDSWNATKARRQAEMDQITGPTKSLQESAFSDAAANLTAPTWSSTIQTDRQQALHNEAANRLVTTDNVQGWGSMSESLKKTIRDAFANASGKGMINYIRMPQQAMEGAEIQTSKATKALAWLEKQIAVEGMSEGLMVQAGSFLASAKQILSEQVLSSLQSAYDSAQKSSKTEREKAEREKVDQISKKLEIAEPGAQGAETTGGVSTVEAEAEVSKADKAETQVPAIIKEVEKVHSEVPAASSSSGKDIAALSSALDKVASLLRDIASDVSTISRVATARTGNSRQWGTEDVTSNVLQSLTAAAARS